MKDFKAIAKANSFDYCLKLRFIRNSIMNYKFKLNLAILNLLFIIVVTNYLKISTKLYFDCSKEL